jgi:hypothetical protein
MTLDEFRQSLTATEPPAGLTHALAGLWWDAKGDWKKAHESAPSRTKAYRVLGSTPTCIARKAIRAPQLIGTVGQVSPFVGNRSMRNGSA